MSTSKIAVLDSQDMIKLRNNLNYIPIHATEIKESLDSYKESLEYKSTFINRYHYNTNLSPETHQKKILITAQAKEWQKDLTSIFKTKLKKKVSSVIERVKEEGEFESSAFDSYLLRNMIQKMKIDQISRRISLETHKAKIQNFNINKLKKKVEKEINMKKFKDKGKKSIWNRVQIYKKPTIDPHIPQIRVSNTFDFMTELTENY
jgi:hypothetical protein